MAKVATSSQFPALRGRAGDLVYRQQYGRTIAQLPPRPSGKRKSAAQKAQQKRFKKAQAYAARILADPLKQELYRKLAAERNCPPNSLLISNYLTPPSVDRIIDAAYRGRVGDVISILASDDIEVVSVVVTLRRADGSVVERGAAEKDHGVWNYSATTNLPSGQGVTIEAIATDRPGNEAKATLAHV